MEIVCLGFDTFNSCQIFRKKNNRLEIVLIDSIYYTSFNASSWEWNYLINPATSEYRTPRKSFCKTNYFTTSLKPLKKTLATIADALRNLVPIVQFKKRKKHPWRSVTLSKVFFTFFKLYKWYQIAQRITYMYWLVIYYIFQVNIFCLIFFGNAQLVGY